MLSAQATTAIFDALVGAADRLGSMIETIDEPGAPALGTWTIADVAAHVSHALAGDTMLLNSGDGSVGLTLSGGLTRGAIAELNETMLESDPERDLRRLAVRIRAGSEDLVAAASALGEGQTRAWLEGLELPAEMIGAHALGEVVLHGFDIARVAKRAWAIEEREATLVLEGFWLRLMAILQSSSHTSRRDGGIGGVPSGVEIRLRGGRVTRLDRGGDGKIDCRISADPRGFLLFVYGRRRFIEAFVRDRWTISGRRPWIAGRVLRALRTP